MRRKHWPRHGGLGLGLGVGGGGVGYLLNDSFTNDVAAGAFAGANLLAVPGPGTRTVTDANSKYSITGGKLSVAANVGDAVSGLWEAAFNRVTGKMLVASIDISATLNGVVIGTDVNQVGIGVYNSFVFAIGGSQLYAYDNNTLYQIDTYSGQTYHLALVFRSIANKGAFYLAKDATNNKWYLYYISKNNSSDPLYPVIQNSSINNKVFTSSFLRIPTMLWTPRPISADAFGSAWPTTDGGGLTGLEAGGSGKTWTTAVGATWSNAGGFAVNAPGVGAEKVTNGTFATDIAGWNNAGGGDAYDTFEWAAGVLHIVTDGSAAAYGYSDDNIALVAQTWYRTDNDYSLTGGTAPTLTIRDAAAGTIRHTAQKNAPSSFRSGATENTVYQMANTAAASEFTLDNITVKPLTTAELIQVIDNGVEDFYAEIDITAAAGFQAGIVFNYTDANNFEVVYLNMNDNKVYWDQCLLGTYTNINTSAAVTPGAGYKLAIRRIGTSLYYWYNNIYVHNNTIVSGLNTTSQGLFSTGNGATEVKFDNWKLYAVGSGGEYSLLDMFCN